MEEFDCIKKFIGYAFRLFTSVIYFPVLVFLLMEMAEIYGSADSFVQYFYVVWLAISIVAVTLLVLRYDSPYPYILCIFCGIILWACQTADRIDIPKKAQLCLESGRGVWDYDQNICREDCYKWTKEEGCFSHCGDGEIFDIKKGCIKNSEPDL